MMRKTGRNSLMARTRLFDVTNVTVPLAQKVMRILDQYDKDSALTASAGAGTFYLWVRYYILALHITVFHCFTV